MSETTDQIQAILSEATVDRTRPNSRLKGPEITRIMELLVPVITALEESGEPRERPQWYGITYPQSEPVITAAKKNLILPEFLKRAGIEDILDRVTGSSFPDENGKRVYYYYTIPTKDGIYNLYVVHSEYLSYIPRDVLVHAGLAEEETAEEEE